MKKREEEQGGESTKEGKRKKVTQEMGRGEKLLQVRARKKTFSFSFCVLHLKE